MPPSASRLITASAVAAAGYRNEPALPELEAALALRRSGADSKALRRALRRIEELLDE